MCTVNTSIAAITRTAPIDPAWSYGSHCGRCVGEAPRRADVAGREEREDEDQAAEDIERKAKLVARAAGRALADHVKHQREHHRQHTEQQIEMEVARHPLGVVHQLVDADGAVDDSRNDAGGPAEHRQHQELGRHAPAHARSINIGQRAIDRHGEHRQARAIGNDLAHHQHPVRHDVIHHQVVRIDDQHHDEARRPRPQERRARSGYGRPL